MAEVVSSAVVQESVSQILSGLFQKYEEKQDLTLSRNLEKLEMAYIRLEAALETSEKWQITDASLLRWRRKLKHAAQECGETLHKCKHRILEKEQMEQEVRNSSLPSRIVHATKSFACSIFNNSNELNRSIVQRFDWFADGATEFLRFVELGGTPRRHMPFDPLVNHLFAGKELHHKIVRRKEYPSFLLWLVPFSTTERGIEVSLIFIHKDNNALEGNFFFSIILQLSESTDIVGIANKCLQLFSPHFKSTVEIIRKELSELPIQLFSWVPFVYSSKKEHWENLHILVSQWFRSDPLCCKQYGQHELGRINNLDISGLSKVSLEPVIEVNLQCHVSLSAHNEQKSSLSDDNILSQDYSYLKAGIVFAPHGSSEDWLPVNKCSSIVEMVGEVQNGLHTDITLEQLQDIMLPKAIDYFCRNSKATVCQMIWKSKHGSALIQVEKSTMSTRRMGTRTRRNFEGAKKRKLFQGHHDLRSRTCMISHLLDLWGPQVPARLQGSIVDWMQKENEIQLSPPKRHQKF